jgi:hypothetical protein
MRSFMILTPHQILLGLPITEVVLHIANVEMMRNAIKAPVGICEEKRLYGTPRSRWEDNIKLDLKRIGWEGVDLNNQTQNRGQWRPLVNAVSNIWVP